MVGRIARGIRVSLKSRTKVKLSPTFFPRISALTEFALRAVDVQDHRRGRGGFDLSPQPVEDLPGFDGQTGRPARAVELDLRHGEPRSVNDLDEGDGQVDRFGEDDPVEGGE